MYLALLAGGQILRKIVRKTLGPVKGNEGLAIFDFSDSDDYRLQMKNKLKDCINRLPFDHDEKEEIAEEKMRIFRMCNAVAHNVKPTKRSMVTVLKIFFIMIIGITLIGTVVVVLAR
jgi:heme oxygenase